MIVLKLLCQIFLPDLVVSEKSIMDYTISDWLWDFWDVAKGSHTGNGGSFPIDFPLWFIRDLMVVAICSPIVYCVVRWLRHYAVILLGIMWILGLKLGITGFSTSAFFFFTLGAYFSINGKNFVSVLRPCMITATIMYFLLAALELYSRNATWATDVYLHSINILLGMVVAITATSYFIERGIWKVSTFLAAASFFVYVYHAMPQIFINKLSFKLVHPHSDTSLLVLYVVCPALTVSLGLALYWGLMKLFPRFTAVITGGR